MLTQGEPSSSYDETIKQWVKVYPSIQLYIYRYGDYFGFIREEYDHYFHFYQMCYSVDDNIHAFMARYRSSADYRPISLELFYSIFDDTADFKMHQDEVIPRLMKRLRHIRLNNDYVSDEENDFFHWLGFDKFYPSRHIVISKNGFLPIYL